jgi:hypothetical protein
MRFSMAANPFVDIAHTDGAFFIAIGALLAGIASFIHVVYKICKDIRKARIKSGKGIGK